MQRVHLVNRKPRGDVVKGMGVEGVSGWEEVGKGRSAFEVYDEGEEGQRAEGRLERTVSLGSFRNCRRASEKYQRDIHMYRSVGQKPSHKTAFWGHHIWVLLCLLRF